MTTTTTMNTPTKSLLDFMATAAVTAAAPSVLQLDAQPRFAENEDESRSNNFQRLISNNSCSIRSDQLSNSVAKPDLHVLGKQHHTTLDWGAHPTPKGSSFFDVREVIVAVRAPFFWLPKFCQSFSRVLPELCCHAGVLQEFCPRLAGVLRDFYQI
jgi:hypothetical protein